ncbi:transposase [Bradyrhizobium japonicum]|uniref:transposase n=1 Tax=Bradyrhizobium TaxID=374 RepID=UPI0032E50822
MKRARFTEEQIIGVLREHEAGAKAADLARKHGVSEATLYNWKAKLAVWTSPMPSGCGNSRTRTPS